jgi:hypothetical protein
MERSRLTITTKLGFVGEAETPVDVVADDTEQGEVRLDLRPTADWHGAQLVPVTAYLHPTDAAVLGHQLIEAGRAATAPSPNDPR